MRFCRLAEGHIHRYHEMKLAFSQQRGCEPVTWGVAPGYGVFGLWPTKAARTAGLCDVPSCAFRNQTTLWDCLGHPRLVRC
jgi:hypothetical protein